jgi:hypothetical protein
MLQYLLSLIELSIQIMHISRRAQTKKLSPKAGGGVLPRLHAWDGLKLGQFLRLLLLRRMMIAVR